MQNFLTSSASGAGILAKAGGSITQAASVALTSNGGDITLWANTLGSTSTTSAGISLGDNASIDSRSVTPGALVSKGTAGLAKS